MGIQLVDIDINDKMLHGKKKQFFNTNNTAFVLKPEELRFVQKYIKAAPKQDKRLSFAPRKLETPGYQYTI